MWIPLVLRTRASKCLLKESVVVGGLQYSERWQREVMGRQVCSNVRGGGICGRGCGRLSGAPSFHCLLLAGAAIGIRTCFGF